MSTGSETKDYTDKQTTRCMRVHGNLTFGTGTDLIKMDLVRI